LKVRNGGPDRYIFTTHFATGVIVDISHLPDDKQAWCVSNFEVVEQELEQPTEAVAADDLSGMTVAELREYAEDVGVQLTSGYIPKADLIELIREG